MGPRQRAVAAVLNSPVRFPLWRRARCRWRHRQPLACALRVPLRSPPGLTGSCEAVGIEVSAQQEAPHQVGHRRKRSLMVPSGCFFLCLFFPRTWGRCPGDGGETRSNAPGARSPALVGRLHKRVVVTPPGMARGLMAQVPAAEPRWWRQGGYQHWSLRSHTNNFTLKLTSATRPVLARSFMHTCSLPWPQRSGPPPLLWPCTGSALDLSPEAPSARPPPEDSSESSQGLAGYPSSPQKLRVPSGCQVGQGKPWALGTAAWPPSSSTLQPWEQAACWGLGASAPAEASSAQGRRGLLRLKQHLSGQAPHLLMALGPVGRGRGRPGLPGAHEEPGLRPGDQGPDPLGRRLQRDPNGEFSGQPRGAARTRRDAHCQGVLPCFSYWSGWAGTQAGDPTPGAAGVCAGQTGQALQEGTLPALDSGLNRQVRKHPEKLTGFSETGQGRDSAASGLHTVRNKVRGSGRATAACGAEERRPRPVSTRVRGRSAGSTCRRQHQGQGLFSSFLLFPATRQGYKDPGSGGPTPHSSLHLLLSPPPPSTSRTMTCCGCSGGCGSSCGGCGSSCGGCGSSCCKPVCCCVPACSCSSCGSCGGCKGGCGSCGGCKGGCGSCGGCKGGCGSCGGCKSSCCQSSCCKVRGSGRATAACGAEERRPRPVSTRVRGRSAGSTCRRQHQGQGLFSSFLLFPNHDLLWLLRGLWLQLWGLWLQLWGLWLQLLQARVLLCASLFLLQLWLLWGLQGGLWLLWGLQGGLWLLRRLQGGLWLLWGLQVQLLSIQLLQALLLPGQLLQVQLLQVQLLQTLLLLGLWVLLLPVQLLQALLLPVQLLQALLLFRLWVLLLPVQLLQALLLPVQLLQTLLLLRLWVLLLPVQLLRPHLLPLLSTGLPEVTTTSPAFHPLLSPPSLVGSVSTFLPLEKHVSRCRREAFLCTVQAQWGGLASRTSQEDWPPCHTASCSGLQHTLVQKQRVTSGWAEVAEEAARLQSVEGETHHRRGVAGQGLPATLAANPNNADCAGTWNSHSRARTPKMRERSWGGHRRAQKREAGVSTTGRRGASTLQVLWENMVTPLGSARKKCGSRCRKDLSAGEHYCTLDIAPATSPHKTGSGGPCSNDERAPESQQPGTKFPMSCPLDLPPRSEPRPAVSTKLTPKDTRSNTQKQENTK
ncbi:Hypothetical predicted protein [Marmota monax]|uniref:Uncharacterized protein n=1 Tax=Marmota monax TaxID=9995 RepID=A0A5E4CNB1_MARMO|nr:Hypothetical predicted protein [Marmota monax]